MITPQFLVVNNMMFSKILEEVESESNNMILGENIRKIISDYKSGKYNPPSTVEFDEKIEKE